MIERQGTVTRRPTSAYNLTPRQRKVLARLVQARERCTWYRAGEVGDAHCRGEAVTLASLYYRGLAERRTRSEKDKAFEYRASDVVMDVWREVAPAEAMTLLDLEIVIHAPPGVPVTCTLKKFFEDYAFSNAERSEICHRLLSGGAWTSGSGGAPVYTVLPKKGRP